jgi:hypothetical protein
MSSPLDLAGWVEFSERYGRRTDLSLDLALDKRLHVSDGLGPDSLFIVMFKT